MRPLHLRLRSLNPRGGSARLVWAQVIGQGGQLLALPFLTRAYSPGEYGLYQLGLALALVMQPVASLRNEFVIPVVHDLGRLRRIYRQSLATMLLASALLGASGYLAARGATREVLILMAPLLLGNAWTALDNARLLRLENIKALAIRNLLTGGLTAVFQIALAVTGQPLVLVAWAVLAARLIAIAATSRSSRRLSVDPVRGQEAGEVRTSVTTILAGVVSNASVYGLTLLTAAAYTPAWSGYVGVAQRIVNVPVSLAGQALAQVYQLQAADRVRNARVGLCAFTTSFMWRLLLLASPFVIFVAVLGPVVVPLILGAAWSPAGTIVALLALPAGIQLAVAPVVPLLVMLNRQRQLLVLQIGRLACSLLMGLGMGLAFDSAYAAVGGYALATVLAYLVTAAAVAQAAGEHDRTVRAGSADGGNSLPNLYSRSTHADGTVAVVAAPVTPDKSRRPR